MFRELKELPLKKTEKYDDNVSSKKKKKDYQWRDTNYEKIIKWKFWNEKDNNWNEKFIEEVQQLIRKIQNKELANLKIGW